MKLVITALALAGLAAPAFAAAPTPAKAPPAAKTPTAAQTASRQRMATCAKQWQADKAAGKTAGQTWPKYYSACSKKLKG